jgi:hypothetical protein
MCGDYYVPGFCSLYRILKEHNVLETGSVLRWKGGQAPTQLGPI